MFLVEFTFNNRIDLVWNKTANQIWLQKNDQYECLGSSLGVPTVQEVFH